MRILRSRRIWIGLILLVVGLELIWVVGANWALSSELVVGKINKRPEKLEVLWDSARTFFPGFIDVAGLSVRGQTRHQQWYVELADVRVHMSLVALIGKSFKTYSVNGSGIDFRLRKRQLAGETPPDTAGFAPAIPGLEVDDPPPQRRKKKPGGAKPWRIELHDVHLQGTQRFWILALEMAAKGSIDADFTMEVGGDMALERVWMDLAEADLSVMGDSTLRHTRLLIDARLDPFSPKRAKGLEVLESLTGRVEVSGQSTLARLINGLLARFDVIEVGAPGGQFEGELRVDRGALAHGTDFDYVVEEGWVDLFGWRASGRLDIGVEVDESSETRLDLAASDLEVTAGGEGEPLLTEADIRLQALARNLDASTGLEKMSESLETASFDLVEARVADVTRVPLPAIGAFRLDSGEILVEGHADFDRNRGAEATLDVNGTGIAASYQELELAGDLSVDFDLATTDVTDGRLEFDDSTFKIDGVRFDDGETVEEEWYFHLDLEDGWIDLQKPRQIVTAAEIRMQDTRPLIAILGEQKQLLRRLRGILNFKDVVGEADLELAARRIEIEDFDVDSEGLKLKANLQIQDKDVTGILYTRFHGIPLAVDLRGEKADLHLRRPLDWYEAQTVPWAGRP